MSAPLDDPYQTQQEGIETSLNAAARIYECPPEVSRPSRPCRDRAAVPVPSLVLTTQATSAAMPAAIGVDAQVIAILRTSDPEETFEVGFRRKELALQGLFISLSVATSRDLHRRLTSGSPRDDMSKLFGRLVAERRSRLLAVLADAPRRDALKRAGLLR